MTVEEKKKISKKRFAIGMAIGILIAFFLIAPMIIRDNEGIDEINTDELTEPKSGQEPEIEPEPEPEPKPKTTYVGSKNSDVYHYTWCHYVDRIKSGNKRYFSSSQAARAAGYRPCKVCKPP